MPADRSAIINMLRRVHLFQGMEDAKLEAAADLMEAVDFSGGEFIYAEGEAADYFYFIVEGQVALTRSPNALGHAPQAGTLEEDDYFGEEVLEYNWPRQVTAATTTDVKLARVSVPDFITMLEIIPPLAKRLQLILDSYRLWLKTHLPWMDADESVYFIARKHVLFLFVMIVAPALAGTFGLLVFGLWFLSGAMMTSLVLMGITLPLVFGWLAWNYIDWSNDYYIVTNKRIVYQERVILLYDSRQESPLEAVQSTTINTSQWGRWLGYGNVAIRTYIGTILFRSIAYPEHIQVIVQEQQIRAQYRETRTEIKRIRTMIDKRIREGPSQPSLGRQKKPPATPDPMRVFLSTMFHLRYEAGGAVVFRTHWFILLKKILIPSLILAVIFGLFVYAAINRFDLVSLQAMCGLLFMFGLIDLGWWFYQYLDWHNDVYLITGDQVIDVNKKPLGREERQAAPIKNILSIEYKRVGLIGLALNFGTVYIRVGDQQLTFDDVLNPSEVQRELFHRLAKKNYEERVKQAENDRARMAEWIATYNEWQTDHQPPKPTQPPRQGF